MPSWPCWLLRLVHSIFAPVRGSCYFVIRLFHKFVALGSFLVITNTSSWGSSKPSPTSHLVVCLANLSWAIWQTFVAGDLALDIESISWFISFVWTSGFVSRCSYSGYEVSVGVISLEISSSTMAMSTSMGSLSIRSLLNCNTDIIFTPFGWRAIVWMIVGLNLVLLNILLWAWEWLCVQAENSSLTRCQNRPCRADPSKSLSWSEFSL